MTGPSRSANDASINFTFDGRALKARAGDTLAAALLANGIALVGRSFKYHRPRGIMAAGVEEPNALVTVGTDGRAEPNTRATDVFVYEGLQARSQNRWPSLAFDMGAVIGLFAKALPAGFYYKTFFGPAKLWLFYEWFIRRAAGLGNAPTQPDPDRFSQRAAFCDLLVVGGGEAGLEAARAAATRGERVILVEQDAALGGMLLSDGNRGHAGWIEHAVAAIESAGGTILKRTTAAGYWEHDLVTLVQRLAEPGQDPPGGTTQRLWHVRAGRTLLATGCIERPLAFAHNDRPGVMLSQAVRTYVHRFGVLPGRRVVIATNNDDAYATADALAGAGAEVVAILDSRAQPGTAATEAMTRYPVHTNARVMAVFGARHHLRAVEAAIGGRTQRLDADLLAMSGGFTPVTHLHMQAGGALAFDKAAQAFTAAECRQNVEVIGGAAAPLAAAPLASLGDPKKSFVDFQNDVTLADVDLAWAEGYRSVEHLKRYTTLGMATDQGKTSNMAALARLADRGAVTIPEAGLTTFRPPYTPVTMGALAGRNHRDAGAHVRRMALWDVHQAAHPIWQPAGYWKRPRAFPRGGEDLAAAARREAQTVRGCVGMTDVSTLAKFEVSGPDAARLLERICATRISKLAVERGRYTFMLREDGLVFDDGTVWRLDDERYLLTSSTGGADRMAAHLSYVRQVLHPDWRVSAVNVQEHYAGIAVAGPRARTVMAALTGIDPPRHMSMTRTAIAGVPILLLAASYSGERAFEIHVDAGGAAAVWAAIADRVAAEDGCAYGLEAMEILRIEKGHVVVGGEVDGRCSPHDLGLGGMLNPDGGYIGAAGLTRPALSSAGRLQLVGLESTGGTIPEGGMLMTAAGRDAEGHVTAAAYRVESGAPIALALLRGGASRHGEVMVASSLTRSQHANVRIVAPHFYDSSGERYRD